MSFTPEELSVTVEFAKDLQDKEWVGRQDPYCLVRLGSQSFRSRTAVDGGRNPVWDETFVFNVESENDLELDIRDDELLRDEPLGTAACNLARVRMAGTDRLQLPVVNRRTGRQHGIVSVSMRWSPAAGMYPAAAEAYGMPQAVPGYGAAAGGDYGGTGYAGGEYGSGGGGYGSGGVGYGGQQAYGEAQPPSRVVEEVEVIEGGYPSEHHHHHQHHHQGRREGVEEVIAVERPEKRW